MFRQPLSHRYPPHPLFQRVPFSVDIKEGGKRICGIFSATHIARRLGVEVSTHEVAASFAQIEAALAR